MAYKLIFLLLLGVPTFPVFSCETYRNPLICLSKDDSKKTISSLLTLPEIFSPTYADILRYRCNEKEKNNFLSKKIRNPNNDYISFSLKDSDVKRDKDDSSCLHHAINSPYGKTLLRRCSKKINGITSCKKRYLQGVEFEQEVCLKDEDKSLLHKGREKRKIALKKSIKKATEGFFDPCYEQSENFNNVKSYFNKVIKNTSCSHRHFNKELLMCIVEEEVRASFSPTTVNYQVCSNIMKSSAHGYGQITYDTFRDGVENNGTGNYLKNLHSLDDFGENDPLKKCLEKGDMLSSHALLSKYPLMQLEVMGRLMNYKLKYVEKECFTSFKKDKILSDEEILSYALASYGNGRDSYVDHIRQCKDGEKNVSNNQGKRKSSLSYRASFLYLCRCHGATYATNKEAKIACINKNGLFHNKVSSCNKKFNCNANDERCLESRKKCALEWVGQSIDKCDKKSSKSERKECFLNQFNQDLR